jgi:hypothetical protein
MPRETIPTQQIGSRSDVLWMIVAGALLVIGVML